MHKLRSNRILEYRGATLYRIHRHKAEYTGLGWTIISGGRKQHKTIR